jgi:hypothetical protein
MYTIYDSTILNLLPSDFFSLCILAQLVMNSRLITEFSYNFPIIDKEFYSNFFYTFVLLLLL